ncbi:oxidoreductase [Aureimonas ureilytica]|uniref:Oxidoreductase n=1 Tax=Aureimonas ureilytica TaxID=401562 RepID=A0A175RX71_9HYPH|nr:SDR family oxidoreductase [Aureimonas ureilytica]KTR08330.1 oxidoreductase [Aureimonas ureilytica]
MRFTSKRLLITGGTSGMGLAGALRIRGEGGQVIVTGRDAKRIEAARAMLGPGALVVDNDAADPEGAAALADIIRSAGGIDGLWLNAAYASLGAPQELDAAAFDAMMAANARGPALQLAKLMPFLNPGASVVVTASSSVYEGAAATGLYAATKGALVAFVRSWARALASRGIRVNTLVLGPIATNLRAALPVETREDFERFVMDQVPLGRVGTAEEAAAVALFLLSDDASFVTGSQYAVDGGMVMR